jgi:tetratricopeptide (TPR) repeat protein
MQDHLESPKPPIADDDCPPAELLALYVEGRCPAAELAGVERHVAQCEECYAVFIGSVRMEQAEGRAAHAPSAGRRPAVRWLAVALAAAAAVLLLVRLGWRGDRDANRELQMALLDLDRAGGTHRYFDVRLSSMPTYRPVYPATRSAGSGPAVPAGLQAASERVRAAAGQDAGGERARSAMYLALGDAGHAAAELDRSAGSRDPLVMNDVAAAWLARAADGDEARARALLERAAAIDPGRPEIWFNLALAAGATGDRQLARTAFARAISLEPGSPWADEARRRLEQIRD